MQLSLHFSKMADLFPRVYSLLVTEKVGNPDNNANNCVSDGGKKMVIGGPCDTAFVISLCVLADSGGGGGVRRESELEGRGIEGGEWLGEEEQDIATLLW